MIGVVVQSLDTQNIAQTCLLYCDSAFMSAMGPPQDMDKERLSLIDKSPSSQTKEDSYITATPADNSIPTDFSKISRKKELLIIFSILLVVFVGTAVDMLPIPFFPTEAKKRGIAETQIGLIFASYDLARFVFSPLSGILVSTFTCIVEHT